tara:strand:- start:13259 stop:13429 length:171 start_codon:yes stop_codon:yes gene_type:complete
MKQKFEKLAKMNKRKEVDRQVAESFVVRQANREADYQKRAKQHSPNEQFYARSYNL